MSLVEAASRCASIRPSFGSDPRRARKTSVACLASRNPPAAAVAGKSVEAAANREEAARRVEAAVAVERSAVAAAEVASAEFFLTRS
jgi:hypothetical protein